MYGALQSQEQSTVAVITKGIQTNNAPCWQCIGFKGLLRKDVILSIVALGAGLDFAFGIDYIRTAITNVLNQRNALVSHHKNFLKKAFEMLREKGNEGKDGK